jgi:hypothetical protein
MICRCHNQVRRRKRFLRRKVQIEVWRCCCVIAFQNFFFFLVDIARILNGIFVAITLVILLVFLVVIFIKTTERDRKTLLLLLFGVF